MSDTALIVVDLQRDFCPGGALPVPGADEMVAVVNSLVARAAREGIPIYATRDWHTSDHCSFREQGGRWPAHCVAGTDGAAFHPDLQLPESTVVVSKATRPDRDAYSGFQGTDLGRRLHAAGVTRVVICGLATDYCIRATTLDALGAGHGVLVVRDAIRGVNVEPGDSGRALDELQRAGAGLVAAADVELRSSEPAG